MKKAFLTLVLTGILTLTTQSAFAATTAKKAVIHPTTNGQIYTVTAGYAADHYQKRGMDVVTIGFKYKEAGGTMLYTITDRKTKKVVAKDLLRNLQCGVTQVKPSGVSYQALSPAAWQKAGGYSYLKDFTFRYGKSSDINKYRLATVYTVEVGHRRQNYKQELDFTLSAKTRMADKIVLTQVVE